MTRLRKPIVLALALVLACSTILSACSSTDTPEAETADPAPAATDDAAATPDAAEENPIDDAATPSADVPGDIDLSQEVALTTWLLGDTPQDNDLVYGQVNEILKERINTTLDINYIGWSDAPTKYQLLFASGEEFDQCYTAFWTAPVYQVLAGKNAFMELTEEMLTTYAPGAYEQLPEAALKQNYVDGKLYTFPKSGRAFDFKTVVLIRGDLREKYELPECNSVENLNTYLYTIAEKEPGIVPYQVEEGGGMIASALYEQSNDIAKFTPAYIICDIDDPNQELSLMADDPKFLELCQLMKDWRDKGVIPADAASKKNSSGSGEAFVAGKSAMFAWNVNIINAYNTVMDEHPEWKPEVYDISPDTLNYPTPYRDGVAISPNSKNWERCLMVQEQLRTDKELWDMTNYGIIGTHWNPVGEDKYEALPDAKNFPANGSCQWGWQTDFQRVSETMPQSYIDIENNWKSKETFNHYLNGFNIDATSIKSIDANMENLKIQYYNVLTLGAMEDPAAGIAEWKQKMTDAGLDEYMTVCKEQAAAYAERMK